jgi:hypothetical protein
MTGERGDPQAGLLVDETHAVAAANRNAGLARHRRDSLRERGFAVGFQMTTRKDRRGSRTVADRLGECGFDLFARNAEHDLVDGFRKLFDRRKARESLHIAVAGIDRIERAAEASRERFSHRVVSGRVGPLRRAEKRDRARGE